MNNYLGLDSIKRDENSNADNDILWRRRKRERRKEEWKGLKSYDFSLA